MGFRRGFGKFILIILLQSSTMRILLALLASMTVLCATAQSHLPVPASSYGSPYFASPWGAPFWQPGWSPVFVPFDNSVKRWQVRPYASVSAGVIIFNGATSYLSAPMGVALIRPLNNNLAAFGNLSVAPTVFSMTNYGLPSASPFSGSYGLGLSSRVEGGLIYTNDAHTFSISGSVSVERGGYPIYPSSNRPANHPASAY